MSNRNRLDRIEKEMTKTRGHVLICTPFSMPDARTGRRRTITHGEADALVRQSVEKAKRDGAKSITVLDYRRTRRKSADTPMQ